MFCGDKASASRSESSLGVMVESLPALAEKSNRNYPAAPENLLRSSNTANTARPQSGKGRAIAKRRRIPLLFGEKSFKKFVSIHSRTAR
jgi:hypothetical protein